MNKAWHDAHVMPAKASREQRVAWHAAHEDACGCRPVPESLKAAVRAFKKRAERTD
jgi:hypothetical protein